jgi:hypothetical protein
VGLYAEGAMTTRNTNLDAVTAVLEAAGVHYTIRHSKHVRVRWIVGGHQRLIVVSRTGSDRRGDANARCTVRRMLRQDGVLKRGIVL